MSLTISWCHVCEDGSLEGDPAMVCCQDCNFDFHLHCAVDADSIEVDLDETSDVPSTHCPKCRGQYIDPADKARDEGMLKGALAALSGETLELNFLRKLTPEDAEIIVKHTGTLILNGLKELSDESAEILTKHQGDLYLSDSIRSQLSDAATESLSKNERVLFVKELTASLANEYRRENGYLILDDYQIISDEAAEILSTHPYGLELNSLVRLSDVAAEHFSGHGLGLELDGLTELSESAAESFSRSTAEILSLTGLNKLSFESAKKLAGFQGEKLIISGKLHFNKQVREILQTNPSVEFGFIEELSDDDAKCLINYRCDIWLNVTALSDAAAESLSKHQGKLNFWNIKKLSDAAAESLSKHQGELSFVDLNKLSDAVAESLSKHQGNLNLEGLTELSDAAAESLSKHQGDLGLYGLTELSESAAESLSKHQGEIDLSGLKKISKKSRKILSMNPDIKLPEEEAE